MATIKKAARKHLFWLWKAQNGICAICWGKMPYPTEKGMAHIRQSHNDPTVDHVWPVGRGGLNVLENMTAVHSGCNQARSNGPATRRQKIVQKQIAPLILMERLRLANFRDYLWWRDAA